MGTRTPWGTSDYAQKVASGIMFYGTPSHGGYHLSPKRNLQVHPALRDPKGWYEEDCDYAIVYFSFPHLFPGKVEDAIVVLKNYRPDAYTEASGEAVRPEESRVLRERIEREANRDKYVTVAAYGDWHARVPPGHVGVFAVRGGRDERGRYASDDHAYFILPADVERKVIDETKFQKVAPWT